MQTTFLDFLTKSTGDYDPSLFDLESHSTGNEDQVSQKEQIAEFYNFLNNVCKPLFFNDSEEQSTAGTIPSGYSIHNVPTENATALPPEIRDNNDLLIKKRLIAIIQSCYFESGIWTEADEYFDRLKTSRGDSVNSLGLLADIVNHNLSNDHILEGVLHILSNYSYAELDPYGITISLACAVNHSPVIQDLLISCFEKWDAVEAIDILQKLELEDPWLIEYRDEVIEQLKSKEMGA